METMACVGHATAVAVSMKGEATVAPLTGAVTLMSARAGRAHSNNARDTTNFISGS